VKVVITATNEQRSSHYVGGA